MLIYNVTVNVEDSIHLKWLDWMQKTHIPEVLATGKFLEATMSRVMVEEELGGITYSVQYKAKDRTTLDAYYKEDADGLRKKTLKNFGNSLVAFRTELEVISIEKVPIKSATNYLFSYGTLLDEEIQKMVFSRVLKGSKDQLKAHSVSPEKVGGLYPTIQKSGNAEDKVNGSVFIVSEEEMHLVDSYEGEAYLRKEVILESGIKAWVYLGKMK
ncbi:DUF4286 family protein [Muriicola soli]|uniref:Putative gamma-glutamylcyclotransferase n=1 Tax=Muriicola soli TaxID=2507538 RepID=A0A411E6N2_9FLAO|nr:DUF4286 family protein [Muriicola soli]